jgi:hypothetical protein
MSKYFALVSLALLTAGCASTAPQMSYNSQPTSPTALVGHDGDVEWSCAQTEDDATSILFNCRFHNVSRATDDKTACIQLQYFTNVTQELVAKSGVACSGPLKQDAQTNRIVPFGRGLRGEVVGICGSNTANCRVLVRQQAVPTGK